MAFTAYYTWVSETLTTTRLNEQVRDNGNAIWPPAGQLVGVNTTEQTMASTTAADLVTITLSSSITVDYGFFVDVSYRKTTGAAEQVAIGLKLNTTIVVEAQSVSAVSNVAANGTVRFYVGPRSTNYLAGVLFVNGGSFVSATGVRDQAASITSAFNLTNLVPNATITSVVIRGSCGNAAITLGVKEVLVTTIRGSTS